MRLKSGAPPPRDSLYMDELDQSIAQETVFAMYDADHGPCVLSRPEFEKGSFFWLILGNRSFEGNRIAGYSSGTLLNALNKAMKINKVFMFRNTKDFARWLLDPENIK